MPAVESTIRSRIQTIIQSVDGITSTRVVLGLDDLSAGAEFLNSLITDGVYVLVLPAEQPGYDQSTRTSDVEVRCKLWFGFASNADYTFSNIETTVYAIRDALKLSSNWSDHTVPNDIRVNLSDVDRSLNPHVGVYEIIMTFSV